MSQHHDHMTEPARMLELIDLAMKWVNDNPTPDDPDQAERHDRIRALLPEAIAATMGKLKDAAEVRAAVDEVVGQVLHERLRNALAAGSVPDNLLISAVDYLTRRRT